jgi:hypothetical protein
MKQNLPKYLLALFGACLLFGLSSQAITSSAQSNRTEPFVLRFVEMSLANTNFNQSIVLVFIVRPDGTTSLFAERQLPGYSDPFFDSGVILWQQTGTISPDQLQQVIAVQQSLTTMPSDQYWPVRDYLFDYQISRDPYKEKQINLNHNLKHGSSKTQAALEKAVQTMLYIRKPFEPLVAFGWSGGFGKRDTQLTVLSDGHLTYEDKMLQKTVADKMTQPDLDMVQQLISSASFKGYPPLVKGNCSDCWTYSVVSVTQDGFRTTEFDQNALESGPKSLKTLVTLLADLSNQEALIKIATTPLASSTPTVLPTTGSSTASPNDVKPTSTRVAGATAKPSPTPIRWESTLTADDAHIELDVLKTSDEIIIGAVKRFQLQPGQVPTECAVFTIRGPMALEIGLFGPGVVERSSNMTDAMIAQRIQDGIELLSQYCDKEKIKIVRVP